MSPKNEKKNFVLDTNVLLDDPYAFYNFDDNTVIIPLIVIQETDNNKDRQDAAGKNARDFIREINELRKLGSLEEGISLMPTCNGILKILSANKDKKLPDELKNSEKGDDILLSFMLSFKEKAILVTNDFALQVKASILNIEVQEYKHQNVKVSDDLYTGLCERVLSDDEWNDYLKNKKLITSEKFFPNQFVKIKSQSVPDAEDYLIYDNEIKALRSFKKHQEVFGITPKNKEQTLAMNLLMDDNIDLVSINGPAGGGKTLLSVAVGLHKVIQEKKFSKLVILKPTEPVGRDVGFLPGDLHEKILPFSHNFMDAFDFIFTNKKDVPGKGKKKEDPYFELLMENGVIELGSIAHIRGRSISNAFIIVDELQNVNKSVCKTILTRTGSNSKIVALGDLQQIDANYLTPRNNGLSHLIESFKNEQEVGHITLSKGERSKIATLAAKLL